jgi:hypothetical protein
MSGEEEKIEQVQIQEEGQSEEETEKAPTKEELAEREALIAKQEELNARQEALNAKAALGGKAEAGKPSEKVEEESPKEYMRKIMTGEI